MISFEQSQAGIIRYIDTEVIPKIQMGSFTRLAIATYLGLSSDSFVAMLHKYKNHPLVEVTNLIRDDHIDIERLYSMLAEKYTEPICFSVPLVGLKMRFTREDLDQLYSYMR